MVAEAAPLARDDGKVRDLGPLATVLSALLVLSPVVGFVSPGLVAAVLGGSTLLSWLAWQYLYGVNAKRLVTYVGLAPLWGVLGWFVPFANAFMPQTQLVAAARAAHPDDLAPKAPVVVYLWWVTPIAAVAAAYFGQQTVVVACLIAYHVLAVATVQVCTRRQRRLTAVR